MSEAKDQLSYSLDKFDELKAKVLVDIDAAFGKAVALVQKIKADKLATDHAQKTLDFSIRAYNTGLRGSLDLLNAEQSMYQAKSNYSEDLYGYFTNALELKYLAGTLKPKDMQELNTFLVTRQPLDPRFKDMEAGS